MSTSSIARPPSGNPSATGGQVWSWTFPGAPICINLSRNLVARLQNDLDARTHALGDSARELGGLLLGHQRGNDSVVVVDDYVWLPSGSAQNGSYSLNMAELERLRVEHSGGSSLVIGYFRTDFGANLELRDAELDLVARHFSEPTNIVLLICSSRPHTCGFFFWMGEGVISPFSLMDFPLDVARLKFHHDSDAAVSPFSVSRVPVSELLAAADSMEPPSIPPPSIEPHADEPEAELVKWPVLDPVARRFTPPATIVQMPSKQVPVAATPAVTHVTPHVITPVITIAQPPAEKISSPAPPHKDAARENAAHEKALRENPAPAAPSNGKGVWLTIAWTLALLIGLCLSAGVVVLVFRGDPLPFVRPSAVVESKPQPAPAFPLQLSVEAQDAGINIRWDSQSPAAAQAHEGQLTITESGKPPVVIPLTAQQLAIGHIYFQSSAERVEVQLETLDPAGMTSRESVMALSSVKHPAPAVASVQQPRPAVPAQHPSWIPARKVETLPIPARNVSAIEAAEGSNAPRLERSPSRAFKAPSLNRAPSRLPVIDQPAIAAASQQTPTIPVPLNSGILGTRVAPPPKPAPATPASAPQQIAPQQIRVTSSLQAARLVRKVAPVYPQVAIAGRIQGEVRFTAIIAKDGTIRDLKQTAGPSILAKSAAAAVNQWTYQPTLLNGQPVEVETEIDVNFMLSK